MPRSGPAFAVALAVVLLLPRNPSLADSLSPDRRGTLFNLLKHDCGSCHGLTMKGGLGPPLLPEDLEERSNEDLVEVILDGVPGTPMPPWRSQLDAHEAAWMVQQLKEGMSP